MLPAKKYKKIFRSKNQKSKKTGFVSLRYRFILITSIMLVLLLTSLALVLGMLQARTIRSRIETQGLAMAQNLADISIDHLITYNYVALEKLVNQAVNNPDIIYVIAYNKEGRVAGHSGRPDLQNKVLADEMSQKAIEAKEPFIAVNDHGTGNPSIMDVAVPVYLPGSQDRWGTIQVGLSLDLMYQQIRQTFLSILILGSMALVIGILISNWAAQRVTNPLGMLVNATIEAAQGNLEQNISINTRDEVEILATNFTFMVQEVLTQKQQLEHQLRKIQQLQQYAEKIVATMSDGLFAVDMNGIIITANPAAHTILGIPMNHQVKDSQVLELFNKNIQFATYIRQSLDHPLGQKLREIHFYNGNKKQVLLIGTGVLKSDKKTLRQIIFNFKDVTELKKLEAEIRQNQRLADLGTLAAGMAHEIRNPLSAIKTYVALLPKKIEKPGFLGKFQRTVPREINRLNTLTEELLELSRLPKYNFKQIDLKQLLKQNIELLEADFMNRNIDCQIIILEKLPKITADADQLKKVFINLIQNSVQAMPNGGKITIHAVCKNAFVIIDVEDTGHGFSAEHANNIFNPFFTTKAKGTGLGLAITHKVISEHGGLIEAKSQKGKGSCFSVSLPIKMPPGINLIPT